MKLKVSISNVVKYLILIATFIAVLLFFAFPNYNDLKKIYQELNAEADGLESKYITGQGLEKSSDDFKKIFDKLPTYEALFIKKGEELSLITKLEELAEKNNLEQKLDLGLDKTTVNKNIISVPFNFSLSGNFNDFLQYLTTLYELTYNLTIQNIELKQTEDSRLEIHLLGYTYWLVDTK